MTFHDHIQINRPGSVCRRRGHGPLVEFPETGNQEHFVDLDAEGIAAVEAGHAGVVRISASDT
jgi:hypothetical protein